jgi:hypothetical protein
MGTRWSRMSWAEKNELWTRWRQGESLLDIARALHRVPSSVYEIVGAEGGIAPRSRRRSLLALTTTEREEIFASARTRGVVPRHWSDPGASTVDDQPRSRAQSWSPLVSGQQRRLAGLAAESPP